MSDELIELRKKRTRVRKRNEVNSKGSAEWVAGHSLTLNSEEKDMVLSLLEQDPPAALKVLQDLALVGIKTSFKYDRRNDTYMTTLYRHETDLPDSGYTLTARANTFERCIGALLFALEDVSDFDLASVKEIREANAGNF